jgi:radical SAM/Cys-rich protein
MNADSTTSTSDLSQSVSRHGVEPFHLTLARHACELRRAETTTLQINVGLLCNQVCRHCHLEAGPRRTEVMSEQTVCRVIEFAQRARFDVIDITGGAPEMNPHIVQLVEGVALTGARVLFRTNLTSIEDPGVDALVDVLTRQRVALIGSMPSLNATQLEAQRGLGVLDKSLDSLRRLNSRGYGKQGTGLELSLVSNPTGAFLPGRQEQVEKKFRTDLERKWGITFTNLYTFANAPLGRFRRWLEESGNYERYMRKLSESFNPCTVEGLMCRRLLSVSWDGYLYDCDFNQAARLPVRGTLTHVTEVAGPPPPGTPIAVSDHCYACTAGSGFT